MRIELICTGDEVLSGKIVNTNFSHISRRLDEVGLDVIWGTTVGDDRARLLEAFKAASGRADASTTQTLERDEMPPPMPLSWRA